MSGSTGILALAGRGRDPVAYVDGSITDSDSVETRQTLPVGARAAAANLGIVGPPVQGDGPAGRQHRIAWASVRSVVRRRARRCAIVNRTQALVLGFFLVVLASLFVIRAAAPDVYDEALRLPPSWPRWTRIAFLLALTAFITLLAVGVLRRWRWIFWLILLAFLAGVLRVPVAILQLAGALPLNVPSWYAVFQGLIGLAQLAIGLTMLVDYRRAGVWGAA